MGNPDFQFDVETRVEENFLVIYTTGNYSLSKANNLFRLAIDHSLLHNKSKILIDVTSITGSIPFFDRFDYAEFLSDYKIKHALGKIHRIAVVGKEPIVDNRRFGETVAINRGINVQVFTDMPMALTWINS